MSNGTFNNRSRPPQLHPSPSSNSATLRTPRQNDPHSATAASSAAMAQFQQAQAQYLQQLQMQIQHQSQMLLKQQQNDSERAFLAMQNSARMRQQSLPETQYEFQAPPRAPPNAGSFRPAQNEDSANLANPLVASALARRKRQSLNPEALAQMGARGPEGLHQAYSGRRSASSTSRTESAASSTQTPALVLSKPGEAYPTTSTSSSEDGNDASSSHRSRNGGADDSPALSSSSSFEGQRASPEQVLDDRDRRTERDARRRSHVSELHLALGGRRQRPSSVGGPTLQSAPLPNRPAAVPTSLPPASLSPFAASFVPLPLSPTPGYDAYALSPSLNFSSFPPSSPSAALTSTPYLSNKPPPLAGTASVVRQPRGPPSDLAGNFAGRIRKQAVSALLSSRLERLALEAEAEVGGEDSVGLDKDKHGGEDEDEDDVFVVESAELDAPLVGLGVVAGFEETR